MPPRKSNVSQISATDPDGTPIKERDGINIEDLSLPRTMVQRLAKGVLPPNTSLGKDAILAMSKGATVFVNYLAQAASTSTTNANKRTIPPPAVLEALIDLEFEGFLPRVEAELKKFCDVQVGKRNEYRRKVKEGKMGGKGEMEGEEEEGEDMGGRERKRVRRNNDDGEGDGEGEGVSGDGHEQLVGGGQGEGGYGDGDLDQEEEEEEEDEQRRREEEEDDEGDDDDDDDDDEYPDEGRRLSSVEREAHEGAEGRSPRYEDEGGTADEEGLSEVSD